jgi:hypothetical protein
VVAHTSVIPAILEAEMGRIMIGGQPGQKVTETPSQLTSQARRFVVIMPVLSEVLV